MKLSSFGVAAHSALKTTFKRSPFVHNIMRNQAHNSLKGNFLFVQQRSIISNYFVAPMLQERQEKRISVSDSKEIFQRIASGEHNTLTYQQAVEMLSDLAYLIVPFDKTQIEFQQLISRLKLTLANQTGNVKLHQLIDAVTRLNLDSVNTLIRKKVEEGNYSRAPGDICAILYFFATQHKHSHSPRDVELFLNVLRDLRHMEVHQLQIEQIDFLLRAFAYSAEGEFRAHIGQERIGAYTKEVEEFIPRLVEQTSKELLRCNLMDIITIMESFFKLWDRQVFDRDLSMQAVLKQCDMYLSEYLGQSKKDITGSQFASLVSLLAKAQEQQLYKFEQKIIHRLQHIFLNDNAELYVFSMADIAKLYKGFEQLNDYFNRQKVIEGLVDLVNEGQFFEDEAFLEVLKDFHKVGLIEKYQDLGVKARVYFQERFEIMDRKTILGFLELFKELGMLFEDKEIAILMKEHLEKSFHAYELPELFQAYKLLSHNFYRDSVTLKLIEDASKIRAGEPSQRGQVTTSHIRDLIEGLKLHLSYNKRLDSILRTLIKHSKFCIEADRKLFVQYVTYVSDFQAVPLEESIQKRVDEACKGHAFTPQDIAHLKLYGKGVISQEVLDRLILTDVSDELSLSKLALAQRGFKLDEKAALLGLKTIDADCNLIEVIEGLLAEKGIKFERNKILCDGRVRAAFELVDERGIIDIEDQQFAYFFDKEGNKKLKTKGREAEEIAKEHGYNSYKLVSLVEMDFAKDEQVFINNVLFGADKK